MALQRVPSVPSIKSNDGDDDPAAIRAKRLRLGVRAFNKNAKEGIAFLQEHGLVERTPEELAVFLRHTDGLFRTSIGEYLGAPDELNLAVLAKFVESFDFHETTLDGALRVFLASFRLPGEAQKIDRVMEAFAKRYCEHNPGIFRNTDAAYILSFALIMLNTDHHNPSIKSKMTLDQFLSTTRGIDGGQDVDRGYLEKLFASITTNEIRMDPDREPSTFDNPSKTGFLRKQGGRIKSWKRRWFVLTAHCLYYFIDNDKAALAQPQGIIPLENVLLRRDPKAPTTFEVYTASGEIKAAKREGNALVESRHTTFLMSAETSEEAEDWIAAIEGEVAHNQFFDDISAKLNDLRVQRTRTRPRAESRSGTPTLFLSPPGTPVLAFTSLPVGAHNGFKRQNSWAPGSAAPLVDELARARADAEAARAEARTASEALRQAQAEIETLKAERTQLLRDKESTASRSEVEHDVALARATAETDRLKMAHALKERELEKARAKHEAEVKDLRQQLAAALIPCTHDRVTEDLAALEATCSTLRRNVEQQRATIAQSRAAEEQSATLLAEVHDEIRDLRSATNSLRERVRVETEARAEAERARDAAIERAKAASRAEMQRRPSVAAIIPPPTPPKGGGAAPPRRKLSRKKTPPTLDKGVRHRVESGPPRPASREASPELKTALDDRRKMEARIATLEKELSDAKRASQSERARYLRGLEDHTATLSAALGGDGAAQEILTKISRALLAEEEQRAEHELVRELQQRLREARAELEDLRVAGASANLADEVRVLRGEMELRDAALRTAVRGERDARALMVNMNAEMKTLRVKVRRAEGGASAERAPWRKNTALETSSRSIVASPRVAADTPIAGEKVATSEAPSARSTRQPSARRLSSTPRKVPSTRTARSGADAGRKKAAQRSPVRVASGQDLAAPRRKEPTQPALPPHRGRRRRRRSFGEGADGRRTRRLSGGGGASGAEGTRTEQGAPPPKRASEEPRDSARNDARRDGRERRGDDRTKSGDAAPREGGGAAKNSSTPPPPPQREASQPKPQDEKRDAGKRNGRRRSRSPSLRATYSYTRSRSPSYSSYCRSRSRTPGGGRSRSASYTRSRSRSRRSYSRSRSDGKQTQRRRRS